MFCAAQDIIRTNVLTKFYEELLTRINFLPPCSHYSHIRKNATPWQQCFQPTKTILLLFQDIIGTNLLTKFHEDPTINVASRVLTRKNSSPPGGHVFQQTGTILKLVQDLIRTNLTKFHDDNKYIIRTNILTKFHEDWTFKLCHIRKNAHPPGGHFHKDQTINVAFRELTGNKRYIIGTNLLTKFHDAWTINKCGHQCVNKAI
ncbi:hypothetical protein DPMN_035284 [Dreissena polymorpha]|uniref:Uncharacterized protein n=1 Tax=Dreissena polymorpha TaxID=45954 RepID=A0A9D4RKG1_DREPO|nr:hypothetical protein DPMN_035284 [Dreissena polymorpha]